MKKNIMKIFVMSLAIIIIKFFNGYSYELKPEVQFIDVGQADCILIKGSKNYLIDTGSGETSESVVKHLKMEGVEELENIIITHYHEDHYGGLKKILQNVKVKGIILPYAGHKEDIISYVKKMDFNYILLDKNTLLESPKVSLKILVPPQRDKNIENNNSLVILGQIDDISYLFMADAEKKLEDELIKNYNIPRVNILKVGHHGLITGTTNRLLNATKPDFAVIFSDGIGSPSYNVIQRLTKHGVNILRTDKLGSIKIENGSSSEDKVIIKIYNLKT